MATVIVKEPTFVASCVLVAVTTRLVADAGAVTRPDCVTDPELIDQVIAEL